MERQTQDARQLDQPHDGLAFAPAGGLKAPVSESAPAPATEAFSGTESEMMASMLYTDAIIGVGFPNMGVGVRAERSGLADFIGNQHAEHWRWKREALENLPLADLTDLYLGLKGMTL